MVILGLGSNLGDRLSHLRRALTHLKKIPQFTVRHVSPIYISDALLPENAPVEWDTPYLNLALACETHLSPYDLLQHLKQTEIAVGRIPEKRWGPRLIDIDLLAWDDLIQYDSKLHIPHENLHERPFALWPLSDVAPQWIYPLPGDAFGKTAAEMVKKWGSRFAGNAPFHTKQIAQCIETSQLVGILNVTPDSFSDGGKFVTANAALQQAEALVDAGAEIIDIGAESTRPDATPIDAETEWWRLEPILNRILAERTKFLIPPKISIDTRHAAVAKKALHLGVDWINDVSGLDDPAMRDIIAASTCDVVVVHHLGIPSDKNHTLPLSQNPVSLVYAWAEARLHALEKAGIGNERIIFDVGIGFGKTAEQSLQLIKDIAQFKQLGTRLMVGHSRKSFLNVFSDKFFSERDPETLAISLFLAQQGVDYLRVHNVSAHAAALKVMMNFCLSS